MPDEDMPHQDTGHEDMHNETTSNAAAPHAAGDHRTGPQVWFITGSSRGLGRALVRAALDAGDLVVATAPRPDQLTEFAERHRDRVLPLPLDVTDPSAVQAAVDAAVRRFGRLD